MVAHYLAYYDNQIGGGRHIPGVFVGAPYQRGHGIGSFLGGLFRSVLPLLRQGAKAIGKEALRTGLHVIEDVSGNNKPFRDSVRRRIAESGENLKRKANEKLELLMNGSGYKMLGGKRMMHSLSGPVSKRVVRKKVARGKVAKKKKKKTNRSSTRSRTKKKKRKTAIKRRNADIFGIV